MPNFEIIRQVGAEGPEEQIPGSQSQGGEGETPKTPGDQSGQPAPTTPDPTPPAVDETAVWEKIREVSGGRFGKAEDFQSIPEEVTWPDEKSKAAYEFAKKGGDFYAFLKMHENDFEKMDPLDVVRNDLKREKPHLSSESIEAILSDKYKLSEDDYSEEQRKLGKALLEDDSTVARKKLIEEQKAFSVQPEQKTGTEEAEKVAAAAKQQWDGNVKSVIKDFTAQKGLTLTLGEGNQFQFGFSDEPALAKAMQGLEKSLTELDDYGILAMVNTQRYEGASGLRRFAEDIFFLENRDVIMKAVAENQRSVAIDSFVEGKLKPPQSSSSGNAPQDPGDWRKQVAKQMHGR